MTTMEKLPVLDESNGVFDSSSSSDEELDYDIVPTPASLRAAHLRRTSCSSLARSSAPPVHRRPASFRRRVRTCFTTGAVLTAVLLERISYFSIVGNLVLFCTNDLRLSSTIGVTVDLVFIGQSTTSTVSFHFCLISSRQRLFYSPQVGAGVRGFGGGRAPPPRKIFFDFSSPNSDFWCIVGAFYGSVDCFGRRRPLHDSKCLWLHGVIAGS